MPHRHLIGRYFVAHNDILDVLKTILDFMKRHLTCWLPQTVVSTGFFMILSVTLFPKGIVFLLSPIHARSIFLKLLCLLRSNETYLLQSQCLTLGFLTMTVHQVQALSYTQ